MWDYLLTFQCSITVAWFQVFYFLLMDRIQKQGFKNAWSLQSKLQKVVLCRFIKFSTNLLSHLFSCLIPPPTKVNIPTLPTNLPIPQCNLCPSRHPSVHHSLLYLLCFPYWSHHGESFFFTLTVQKTKCSSGWQQLGQIGEGKWHLLFVTASRVSTPRCDCDPPAASLHGGNQRRSDSNQKTPHCSACFLAFIKFSLLFWLQHSLIKFCENEHMLWNNN